MDVYTGSLSSVVENYSRGDGISLVMRDHRDISTSGIFFETESAHAIGDTIRLSLNFEHETLQCETRVVRVEPRNWSIRRRRGANVVCFLLRTKE